jgi:hypothetical protein
MIQADPRYSTRGLEQFGEVTYLLQYKPYVLDTLNVLDSINRALDLIKFDPEVDVIVTTGPFVLVSMLFWVLGRRYTTMNVLVFDAPHDCYTEKKYLLTESDYK